MSFAPANHAAQRVAGPGMGSSRINREPHLRRLALGIGQVAGTAFAQLPLENEGTGGCTQAVEFAVVVVVVGGVN